MSKPNPCVVYLSSSAHSDWREPVRAKYQNDDRVTLVGPCENHGLSDAMGAPGDVKPGHKLRIMQMLRSHFVKIPGIIHRPDASNKIPNSPK